MAVGCTLCAVLAAAWAVSYAPLTIASSRGTAYFTYVRLPRGSVHPVKVQILQGLNDQSSIQQSRLRIVLAQHPLPYMNSNFFPAEKKPNREALGVRLWHGQTYTVPGVRGMSGPGTGPPGSTVLGYFVVAVPHAWLIAFAALLPAAAAVGTMRRRCRARRGRCANCGYDVRASPDRCPECGHGNVVGAGAAV